MLSRMSTSRGSGWHLNSLNLLLIASFSLTVFADPAADYNPADYIPWSWRVKSRTFPSLDYCPPAASILGNFAIINVLVSLVSLFLGNSKIVKLITCGCIDGDEDDDKKSLWWLFMFLFPFGLNLGSNALVAHRYRTVHGFDDFHTWDLTLFYTTRPRLAWVALVIFMNIDTNKSKNSTKYMKSAKAAVLAEIVLQIMSSYYMGWTASFATKHGYYHHPTAAPENANIMYAGALLSLISLFSTLICLVAILIQAGSFESSFTPILMVSCTSWLGSWLFWIGFVSLEGDE